MMPQEIEVWYLIPALRREIAKILIRDYKISQKEIAKILDITEATISQYISSKRASEIKFSKKETAEIKKAADKIIKNKKNIMKNIYNLCIKFRKSKTICSIHKRHNSSLPSNCSVCFSNDKKF